MEKSYVMPLLLLCLLPVLPLAAQQVDECPQVRIEAERLPDLTIPRTGHSIFYAGDELIRTLPLCAAEGVGRLNVWQRFLTLIDALI